MKLATAAHAAPVSQANGEREGTLAQRAPKAFTVARLLLVATLFLAPLAFGAVETWAWASLAVLAVVLLLLWAVGSVQQGAITVHWSPLFLPAALFFLLGLFQFTAGLTLDSFLTRQALLKLATNLIFFFLAVQLVASAAPWEWRRFGLAISVGAFGMGLFAILQFFSSPSGVIFGRVKTNGWAFGPYVNHNHFAGLMEMVIPVAAGFALSERRVSDRKILLAFMVLVAIVSLLISASRGGFLALLVEAAILAWIALRGHDGPGRRRWALALASALVFAALFYLWSAPRWVSRRLETVAGLARSPEITISKRWEVWKDSMGIVRAHPLTGAGLGSFPVAFPPYQTFATNNVWDHAHNDYVEALAETGLLGGAVILAALTIFFRLSFDKSRERLRCGPGWIGVGAAIGCCGLLVHSLSDFNLHIPANALWFVVLAAIATQSGRRVPRTGKGEVIDRGFCRERDR